MENRRVKITKRIIKESLIELLDEIDFNKLSVSRLCETAEINRSTFYAHYNDLFAVMEELERDFITHVSYFRIGESSQKHEKKAYDYLRYIDAHHKEFQILYKNGYLVNPIISESMNLFVSENKNRNEKISTEIHEIFVQYATSGTFKMISYWLENKHLYSFEQVAQWILDLSLSIHNVEKRTIKKK